MLCLCADPVILVNYCCCTLCEIKNWLKSTQSNVRRCTFICHDCHSTVVDLTSHLELPEDVFSSLVNFKLPPPQKTNKKKQNKKTKTNKTYKLIRRNQTQIFRAAIELRLLSWNSPELFTVYLFPERGATWTHTNDNTLGWMQTFSNMCSHIDFKRMLTWWIPPSRHWSMQGMKSYQNSRLHHLAKKHTRQTFLFLSLSLSLSHTHIHTRTHGNLPNESPSQVRSIISIPWASRDCRAQLHDMRVSGVKWNAHSKCHFIFKA